MQYGYCYSLFVAACSRFRWKKFIVFDLVEQACLMAVQVDPVVLVGHCRGVLQDSYCKQQ